MVLSIYYNITKDTSTYFFIVIVLDYILYIFHIILMLVKSAQLNGITYSVDVILD